MTQIERIQKHLQTHKNGITLLEAIDRYGITRLASIICRLRKRGCNIKSELIAVTNRYGEVCYVSKYIMEG